MPEEYAMPTAKVSGDFTPGPANAQVVKGTDPAGETVLIFVVRTPSTTLATFWKQQEFWAMLDKLREDSGGPIVATSDDVARLISPNGAAFPSNGN